MFKIYGFVSEIFSHFLSRNYIITLYAMSSEKIVYNRCPDLSVPYFFKSLVLFAALSLLY